MTKATFKKADIEAAEAMVAKYDSNPKSIKKAEIKELTERMAHCGMPNSTIKDFANTLKNFLNMVARQEQEEAQDAPAPQESGKKVSKSEEKKAEVGAAVDLAIAGFQQELGEDFIIKVWEKLPTCRSLKFRGKTILELYFSAKGVRVNTHSEFIPEEERPGGSRIMQNGLDLYIPTFEDIPTLENLINLGVQAINTKYAEKEAKAAAKAANAPVGEESEEVAA